MTKIVHLDLGLINSDAFLDMTAESQLLYFHFLASRNKEGIVNNPKAIQRMVGVKEDAFLMLGTNGFVFDGDEEGEIFVIDTLEAFIEVNGNGN